MFSFNPSEVYFHLVGRNLIHQYKYKYFLQHIGFKGDVLWISVFRCYTQMFLTVLNRGEYAIEFGVIAENSV